MFGFNNELPVVFLLPHGFKASGEGSILDGVDLEAQLQSLGVRAAWHLQGAET